MWDGPVVSCKHRVDGRIGAVARVEDVARKKSGTTPRRYGTLVRVSDGFAEALRDVTRFERTSVAEFADAHLLPIVRKRYREAVLKEARRVGGGEK
jgi:hypothetical protein